MRIGRVFENIYDTLIYYIKEILGIIYRYSVNFLHFVWGWFLELQWFDKAIVLTAIPAVFPVIFPPAKFFIFDKWDYSNNTFSVYMIGLVFAMGVTMFIKRLWVTIFRAIINIAFLVWTLYMWLGNEITHADPHVVTWSFYFNLIVPVLYLIFSSLSYVFGEEF